jgi:alanyl-tRNA synthetase
LVRVIKFGNAVELCGGTHVKATGEIGFFKILSESSVSAGVRRIEAITASRAEDYINNTYSMIRQLEASLQSNKGIFDGVKRLIDENENLKKEAEKFVKANAEILKGKLLNNKRIVDGVTIIEAMVNVDSAMIKDIAFQLKGECEKLICVIGGEFNSKPYLMVMLSNDMVQAGLHAGQLVKNAAKYVKGGGGGQPFFAMAGGSDASGLKEAVESIKVEISSKVNF